MTSLALHCSGWTFIQSAIAVSKNPEHHSKMKHLSLRLFWLRDAVQDGLVAPTFVGTQEMAADIFTKKGFGPVQSAEVFRNAWFV